jgi:hypothetical protein
VALRLLGKGDILAPPARANHALAVTRSFGAADPVLLALLDESLTAVASRWPRIAVALLARAERQLDRAAVHQLISQLPRAEQRIVASLWHLADRWGRVSSCR